jgi:heme/copper-type cytochrome/quinol oxidase subunit 2
MFGTTVENIPNRDLGVAGVMAWYAGDPVAIEETVESVVETPSGETSSSKQATPLIVMITVIVVILVIVGLGFARVIKIRQRKTTE